MTFLLGSRPRLGRSGSPMGRPVACPTWPDVERTYLAAKDRGRFAAVSEPVASPAGAFFLPRRALSRLWLRPGGVRRAIRRAPRPDRRKLEVPSRGGRCQLVGPGRTPCGPP